MLTPLHVAKILDLKFLVVHTPLDGHYIHILRSIALHAYTPCLKATKSNPFRTGNKMHEGRNDVYLTCFLHLAVCHTESFSINTYKMMQSLLR